MGQNIAGQPPEGKTCDHCNTSVNGDGAEWKYEIGMWFCPVCKGSYWEPIVK